MLKVQKSSRSTAPSTEKNFEKRFAAELKDLGIYSRHMSDSVPGLPDRYIQRGRWVEFKVIEFSRDIAYGSGLSAEQRREMKRLREAGDSVYYVALVQHTSGIQLIWTCKWMPARIGERYTLQQLAGHNTPGVMSTRIPSNLTQVVKEMLWR